MNAAPALRLQGVNISLQGRALVSGLNAQVAGGECLTVMGPSGCGKSTLLAYLAARWTACSRPAAVSGWAAPSSRAWRPSSAAWAFCFRTTCCSRICRWAAPGLCIAAHAARPRCTHGLGGRCAGRSGAARFCCARPGTLSGGQRARVALMRTLLAQPRALLLDEPFNKLDAQLRSDFRSFVFEHARQRALPVLLVTHDEADALAAGGPVIQLGVGHECCRSRVQTSSAQPAGVQALLSGLREALRAAHMADAGIAVDGTLQLMGDKGLAHHHVRLVGTGLIARLPKQSQMGLPAQQNLDYEAACFHRAAASGYVPRAVATLAPSAALPRGGLLVEEVQGRPAQLPGDLDAIAKALAAIHALALPAPALRPPLLDAADPLQALRQEIQDQAAHLGSAGLAAGARACIEQVQARFDTACAATDRPARRLIAFDAHPGNFLLRDDGRAMLVDLEKARYSYPPLDLAHATLYTSTTWDIDSYAELTPAQVVQAVSTWEAACDLGQSQRRWMLPLRAGMWLWSVTWCAKWRTLSPRQASAAADGEDWSQSLTAQALVAHVRERVDCYLSAGVIERVVDELAVLGELLRE